MGLTRFLLRKGIVTPGRRVFLSVIDFVGAAVLFGGLCLALIFAVRIFNGAANAGGFAGPVIDDMSMLCGLSKNPQSVEYFWIYFMALTTLLPTAAHFLLAVWSGAESLVTMWQKSLDKRLRAVSYDGEPMDRTKRDAAWLMSAEGPLKLMVVTIAGCLIIIAAAHMGMAGRVFLNGIMVLSGTQCP